VTDQLAGMLQRISAEMVGIVPQFTWSSVVDIGLVALILYGLFRLFQGTQAVALLRGILVLALFFLLAASRTL
jgi:DNA integrity scanning protein DisA with diadenylate cyclase activity